MLSEFLLPVQPNRFHKQQIWYSPVWRHLELIAASRFLLFENKDIEHINDNRFKQDVLRLPVVRKMKFESKRQISCFFFI